MVRRSPGTVDAIIGLDVDGVAAEVLRSEHVRNHGLADPSGRGAAGSPVLGIPDSDHAVLVGSQANLDVSTGAGAGDFQLLIAVEHELNRAARFFADLRRRDRPIIGLELAAKTAADVV